MMPVIRISDATFASLSTLKTWFGTQTPSETIDLVVRKIMEDLDIEEDDAEEDVETKKIGGEKHFITTPGLAFTKPLAASINGTPLPNPRWATILLEVIGQLNIRGISGERLIRELAIPAKTEQYEEEGFKYYSNLGISIQGQSAQDCWKEVERLARRWRIPVHVEFIWRQNPKAQHPGKAGTLQAGIP